MIKNRSIKYSRIVVLSIPRIEELNTLLFKHCDIINYLVITKNEAEIQFASFDELSHFDNFGDDKIISLSIKCRKNNDYDFKINIDFSPLHPWNSGDTVKCMYCFSDNDKESVFVVDFKNFLDKITIYHTKYMICKWASFVLFFILGLYPIFIPINGWCYYERAIGIYPVIVGIVFFEIISMGLYKLSSMIIWENLFPKAIFAWGEESNNYSKLEMLRSNLFWGVFVAVIISIVAGLILK